MKKKSDSARSARYLRLAHRYFEAETSPREEARLRRYVVGRGADDERFDEVRAVMGYMAAARHAQPVRPSRSLRPVRAWRAAAAVAAIVLTVGTAAWIDYRRDNVCAAYIGGRRVTDTDRVMAEMHRAIHAAQRPAGTPTMEQQLSDIFSQIDYSE